MLSEALIDNETFRFDSEYFKKEYIAKLERIEKKEFKYIEEFALVTDGIHESINFDRLSNIRLISAKAPKENTFDLSRLENISESQNIKNPRTQLQENDVILSTVGTIGNCAVVTKEILPANSDRHVGIIRTNHFFSPFFLSTFLLTKYGRFQSLRESTGNVQLNLFIYRIKKLKIPLLSQTFQQSIENLVKSAHTKLEESKNLYQQAESILLEELLPPGDLSPPVPLKRGSKEQENDPEFDLKKRGRIDLDSEALHETGVFKYNLALLPRAKELRDNPTASEQKLWDEVLRSKKTGYKFTRQKPIDNFILDFYCPKLLLAIEIDGKIHRKQQDYDQARTELLNHYGIEVIRFSNEEVLNDIGTVRSILNKHIEKQKNKFPLLRGLGGDISNKVGGDKEQSINYSIKSLSESFLKTGRLDAEYYQTKYEEIERRIKKGKWDTLDNLVNIRKSIEPGSDNYASKGVPFLRVSDYNKSGITKPAQNLKPQFCKENVELIEKLKPKKETILFSKDGSVGTAYMLREDLEMVSSGAILHLNLKNKKEVLPEYLTLVLNSPLVQMQAERDAGGSIILHWRVSEIEQVLIPIIDHTIQKQIAELIEESFQLKDKSEKLLEIVKRAVEIAIEEDEESAMKFIKQEEEKL